MSTDDRRTWLLALPVLCCTGHAVLVAVGVGSLTGVVGGTGVRVALGAVVVALLATVAVLAVRRRGRA